jgi:hypothetical protein
MVGVINDNCIIWIKFFHLTLVLLQSIEIEKYNRTRCGLQGSDGYGSRCEYLTW